MNTTEVITIGGRHFHGITQELPAAQDHYLIGQLRLAGALELIGNSKADPEDASVALLTQLLVSGRAHHVLAGCLTEEGKAWNVEEARHNATLFAETRDDADKRAMRDALLGLVLGFFQYATASVATSLKSSNPN